MIKNFLFDLDQTLLNFHASERKALKIVLEQNGMSFSDEIYDAFMEYNKSLWLELEKGIISRTELFDRRFCYIIEKCNKDPFKVDRLKINTDFIKTMSENGVLMEGALEFVQRIKKEIPESGIYIVTNGAIVTAEGRIESTGLDKYIDGLFISEAMGVSKPSKEYFDIVLKEIKASQESCMVIGDSLTSDMLGAKNAGLTSVWFMTQGQGMDQDKIKEAVKEYDINYCASSFDELFKILKGRS
ncbi:MAG: YjjG family noncanonical pyrimidine nucleotidase [Treponema sp.]|nr:YjjG family noncanonical pyrimidine nucleotidase [Treponema sp.]